MARRCILNVTKNAWHFKLAKKHYKWWDAKEYPVTLCSYFWHVVWAVTFKFIILPFMFFLGLMVIGLLIFGVLILPHSLLGVFLHHFWPQYFYSPQDATLLSDLATLQLWISDLVFYVIFGMFWWLWYKIKNRKSKPYSARKEDSLVIAWVKAKKDRVCPLIKYED